MYLPSSDNSQLGAVYTYTARLTQQGPMEVDKNPLNWRHFFRPFFELMHDIHADSFLLRHVFLNAVQLLP